MSKPRYDWWTYVKGMIRRYPALHAQYIALHETTITAQLTGMPGGARYLIPRRPRPCVSFPPSIKESMMLSAKRSMRRDNTRMGRIG